MSMLKGWHLERGPIALLVFQSNPSRLWGGPTADVRLFSISSQGCHFIDAILRMKVPQLHKIIQKFFHDRRALFGLDDLQITLAQ